MNKRALEEYALFARNELENQITLSLNKLGIYEDRVLKANIVGDFTVIEGSQETFPKRVYTLRESILTNLKLEERKFSSAVEEYAYTWFNRIVAIRFMEVHDYFDHGFKVLTSSDGSYEPDILKNAHYLIDELNLDTDVILSLKEQNKIEELYRYLLFKQCNALNSILPEMFDNEASYMELLLPNNLLSQDSIIRKLEIIPEEDFRNDVEIVGWLYQYYVASNREKYRKAKLVTKDLIPTLSQIFTPDWIVRYMAENSVGRIWLESYPNSKLLDSMEYYVKDEKQEQSVLNEFNKYRYSNVKPEDIKIIEPCCGSGHILLYVFDLLFQMYIEFNYEIKDIPGLIFKNNIYGLDIDKRAVQLAKFALIMKARSIDKRFFNEKRFVKPRVFEILDSAILIETNYKESMKSLHFSQKSIEITDYLVEVFKNAKTIGSLLKIDKKDYNSLLDDIKRCKENETPNMFEQPFVYYGLTLLKKLVIIAVTMVRKYDVMITNPPYLSSTKFEKESHDYFFEYYPNSKDDMFAMFMETEFVKENGFKAMVNPDSWMFLVSYEKLRYKINKECTLMNMMHIGMGGFDAVVQTTTFVYRLIDLPKYLFRIYSVNDFIKNKRYDMLNSKYYIRSKESFENLPSCQYAYNVVDGISNAFKYGTKIENIGEVVTGVSTGDNDKYVRYWQEVDLDRITFGANDIHKINFDEKPWLPVTKGGNARKWYGNNDAVLLWRDHNKFHRDRSTNKHLYLKQGITWSKITTGMFSARLFNDGFVWLDAGSPCVIKDKKMEKYVLGFLGTNICAFIMKLLNPTISCQVVDVQRVPIIINHNYMNEVCDIVNDCINISKEDWDENEKSWDFQYHPLIKNYKEGVKSSKISDCFDFYYQKTIARFNKLKQNEERLNEIFIDIYGLKNDFEKNVDNSTITVSIAEYKSSIESLISYFVGCLMGRYSLEKNGLICYNLNFNNDNYGDYVDDDGVIPIYEFIGMDDSLTTQICILIKKVFGTTYYDENLLYIAKALGMNNNESPMDSLNRYIYEQFAENHYKNYNFRGQKFPIYWLMTSGKQGAFKCLIYMNRYNPNMLALVNTKYFLPRTAMYKAERERLEFKLQTADIRDKKKLEQELLRIEACEQELLEYGQVLNHVANDYIRFNMDDGVMNNYLLFQNKTLESGDGKIVKNLLTILGNEKK